MHHKYATNSNADISMWYIVHAICIIGYAKEDFVLKFFHADASLLESSLDLTP